MIKNVSSLELANAFIDRFGAAEGIQHMKLQKLAYYCHSWWLSYYDEPFLRHGPEVWKYGPVFPDLYQSLKHFGSTPIRTVQKDGPFGEARIAGGEFLNGLIQWIWDNYGKYSAGELSDRTHAKGTPWRIIAEKNRFSVPMHTPIDDDVIKGSFRQDTALVLASQ